MRRTPGVPTPQAGRAAAVVGLALVTVTATACGAGSSGHVTTPGAGPAGTHGGSPSLAFRTRTVTGVVRAADASEMTIAAGGLPTRVELQPRTTYRELTSLRRADLRRGDCVSIVPVTARRTPSRRTVTAGTVVMTPSADCAEASPNPTPTSLAGTASPFTASTPGFGGAGALSLSAGNTGVLTDVSAGAILVAVGRAHGVTRVLTTAATAYFAMRSGGADVVRAGQCATTVAQLPATTLEAVTVIVAAPRHGGCAFLSALI